MSFDPRRIINSPFALSLAYLISRSTPNRLGYQVASMIADFISARKEWKMVRNTRCNQWIANDEKLKGRALDEAVNYNFRNIGLSIFELYHNIHNPASFSRIIEPHPTVIQLLQRPEFSERGLMIAGVHMSNFDMAFQMGGLSGLKAIALTLPELNAGYQKQRDMRQKNGMRMLQASVGTLKYTADHLKAGGMAITGIDRPDVSYPYRPKFFGRPAALPIHHIFLAVKAHVPILVGALLRQPDGKYSFLFSDPIEMQSHPDRHTEILINAEAVLHVAEDYIRHDPSQWAMTFPVWPEVMNQDPDLFA